MKRMILCFVLVLGISGIINAQTDGGSSSTSSSGAMQSSSKGSTGKKTKRSKDSSQLNNRNIYHWKNGQRATPTGSEATGTNGGYSAIGRDSAKKNKKQ